MLGRSASESACHTAPPISSASATSTWHADVWASMCVLAYLAPDLAEGFEKELIVLLDGFGGRAIGKEQALERQSTQRLLQPSSV